MHLRRLLPALASIWLALGAAEAHADAYDIEFAPAEPRAGEEVSFQAARDNPGSGEGDTFAWNFGDNTSGTGRKVTHAYVGAGTYTVSLTVTDDEGDIEEVEEVEVRVAPPPEPPNQPPSAAFTFSPSSPLVGEMVLFSGGSDPDGDALTRWWDFGDGATSTDAAASHAYSAAGFYTVSLTATDEHGAFASTSQGVTVRQAAQGQPPGEGAPEPVAEAPPTRFARMRPFPRVRIAGVVLPNGADVRILSVRRAARGARIRVRCRGRGCPVRSLTRARASRLVRLRRFERRLPAGVRLELFVTQPRRIGKYTRFVIRAGKPPVRVDRCLLPGRARPLRCP